MLAGQFPQHRFAPEINQKNGSVKFFGWLPDYTPTPHVPSVLANRFEHLAIPVAGIRFQPPGDFSLLAADIRSLRVRTRSPLSAAVWFCKVARYRLPKKNGRRKREYYSGVFLCRLPQLDLFLGTRNMTSIYSSDISREAVARCLDKLAEESKPIMLKVKTRKKPSAGGMGSIGNLKGRCASALVRFWTEMDVPEDDTVGKYIIVTLRILKFEGLTSDEAVDWVEDRLQALEYTEFSDRLTDDFEEIQRVMAFAVEAVWQSNGYQKRPRDQRGKAESSPFLPPGPNRGFRLQQPRYLE